MATTGMAARAVPTTGEEASRELVDVALSVMTELREQGRTREADAIGALIKAEVARIEPPFSEHDLSPEDIAALERGEEQILAGKIIPHDVVMQGKEAVDEFIRKRDADELDPETAAAIHAAVQAFRREWAAPQPAAAPDA